MDEKYSYYRFPVGNVILRKKGALLEKKGKSGVWENAADQLWRFASGDTNLIEIAPPEDERPESISKDRNP